MFQFRGLRALFGGLSSPLATGLAETEWYIMWAKLNTVRMAKSLQ